MNRKLLSREFAIVGEDARLFPRNPIQYQVCFDVTFEGKTSETYHVILFSATNELLIDFTD